MKKLISIITASFLILVVSTSFAHAGAARRHTIEGFLLGTGVTLLGTSIVRSMNPAPEPAKVVVHHYNTHQYRNHYNTCRDRGHRRGHWKKRKGWMKPVYETRWNPGHYNKRGKWVPGRYQEFHMAEGYWKKDRMRIRRNHRR